MKYERIKLKTPSKLFFLPEESFEKETNNTNLKWEFTIDGNFETLDIAANNIMKLYNQYYPKDPVVARIKSIYKYEI